MTDLFISLSLFDASHYFEIIVTNMGYLYVFLFMVIESSFIPFPSEIIVPPAAYLACQTTRVLTFHDRTLTVPDMNIFVVVLVATAGAIVGALINYGLSLWIGRPIVYRFADSRIGHACLINREKVDRAEQYFDKHGAASTFIGRLIPAVRQLISIPAGLAKMNIWKFIIFTGLGAMLWNAILAALGWFLAKSVSIDNLFPLVEEYNSYLTIGGLILLLVCVLFIGWNAFRPKKSSSAKIKTL
ncbi:MAG: DedA family protein [Muribaculaceae bacterium]|nr:DedA family protein [Muribaculaceae bacterium]MDE6702287.1 DedA family protein [Muribaculaceae bacterium]